MAYPTIDTTVTLDFSNMTLDQLKVESLRLAVVLDLVNTQRRQIQTVVQSRIAQVEAQQRLAGLDQMQIDALRALLQENP